MYCYVLPWRGGKDYTSLFVLSQRAGSTDICTLRERKRPYISTCFQERDKLILYLDLLDHRETRTYNSICSFTDTKRLYLYICYAFHRHQEAVSLNPGGVILAKSCLCNPGGVILAVESWLWNPGGLIWGSGLWKYWFCLANDTCAWTPNKFWF